MKKRYTILAILFILSLLLAACNNSTNDAGENTLGNHGDSEQNSEDLLDDEVSDDQVDENAYNSEDYDIFTPEEISDQIIEAIMNEDMETVAHFVHPEKGLLFSPYIYVDDEAVVIEQSDIEHLLDSETVFTWGVYDGKGTLIDLTPAGYFEEFLDMTPYEEPDEILVNDLQNRGNTINNVGEKFPNATIVEYYNDGSEEYEGIDWASVLFVYEEDGDGVNHLIAIIRDMWTI